MTATEILPTSDQRAGLRRMKGVALAFLVMAAVVYLWSRRMETVSDAAVWGYVRAASEAGVVGGLADWFAVTALFRHPLGLPIPHTALIPTKKDQLGESLSKFVHGNFLSGENVRKKVLDGRPSGRVADYLADDQHRRRIVAEGSDLAVQLLDNLNDAEIQVFVRNLVFGELQVNAWSPPAGKLLGAAVGESKHEAVVDALLTALHRWLLENQDKVAGAVADHGPVSQGGPIRWMHERVGDKSVELFVRWVGEVRDDPNDPIRLQLDQALLRIASDMQEDPQIISRVEGWKSDVLRHEETHRLVNSIWPTARQLLVDALQNPDGDLRQRAEGYLAELAERLRTDRAFADHWDERIGSGAAYLVDRYGAEAVAVISETVKRWDAGEASRRIEIAVGRDLQFIRINGTIVGSLAGLTIFTVSNWLL